MSHPFAYAELHAETPAAAVAFYRKLFDWKVNESATPTGPYFGLDTGEGMAGGLRGSTESPARWVVYVKVDDVRAATDRAVSLGARAVVVAAEVPSAGWYSLCVDPTGATFGLWQPVAQSGS
jgi:uncharacterized protein